CTGGGRRSSSSAALSPAFILWVNGGSSYSVKVRERTVKAYSRRIQTIQQTCTLWVSTSRRVNERFSRRLSPSTNHARSFASPRTAILTTDSIRSPGGNS
ncbi:MAG: hypothetical protein GX847_08255, partial [Clostridiales bacterium]|nr:hypothetical protein [Clostridiales bacterium]